MAPQGYGSTELAGSQFRPTRSDGYPTRLGRVPNSGDLAGFVDQNCQVGYLWRQVGCLWPQVGYWPRGLKGADADLGDDGVELGVVTVDRERRHLLSRERNTQAEGIHRGG